MENEFLKIKKAENVDGRDYFYAERKGKDSIAFILWNKDKEKQQVGLIKEFKPPVGKFLKTAFGGSLDQPNSTPIDMCIREVEEEAGFKVDRSKVIYVGSYFVSTQMNQFCHLYLVNVKEKDFVGRKPQDKSEEAAEVVWMNPNEVFLTQDWKSVTIVSVASMKNLIK
jgi:ADP-ribose pyrophosphatase YjhB (NUDIX family)